MKIRREFYEKSISRINEYEIKNILILIFKKLIKLHKYMLEEENFFSYQSFKSQNKRKVLKDKNYFLKVYS